MSRILTGLALLSIGLTVIYLGGPLLFGWLFFISLLLCYELTKLYQSQPIKPIIWLSYLLTILLSSYYQLPGITPIWTNGWYIGLIALLIGSFMIEFLTRTIHAPKHPALLSIRIALISSLFLPYVYWIRTLDNGGLFLLFFFIIVWGTDTFAYYGGKLFGKTQLSPLSPKKTIEGAIIGMIMSTAVANVMAYYLFDTWSLRFIVGALFLSALSQIGDLHQSLTKRTLNAKDSSQLLPGHGGIYDRADSTLFVAPIFYYMLHFFL